jgi:hypothetical protein
MRYTDSDPRRRSMADPRRKQQQPTTLAEALRLALPDATTESTDSPSSAEGSDLRRPLLSPDRALELLAARDEVASGNVERILQARALVLCALPYKRIANRSVTRTAEIGRYGATLQVTYTTIDEGVPLPFGADRALFGWIQTKAFGDGHVSFDSLTEFFDAFGIGKSGREYQIFKQRLTRLQSLALTVTVDAARESSRLHMHPLRGSFMPKDPAEAREVLDHEASRQLLLVRAAGDRSRYGFQLDPDFYRYLRQNPVPLPLPLMRVFVNRPKAWDFASIVLYRSYIAKAPRTLSFLELKNLLGAEDNHARRLKATYAGILEEIRAVYPDLPAYFLPRSQGLLLTPWKPDSAK